MIVIVCGGRDFRDKPKLFAALDFWMPRLGISTVVQGGQVSMSPNDRHLPWEEREKWGADYIAKLWADARRIRCVEEAITPEEWKRIGPGAGPMRNGRMLKKHNPERVISLPGGAGTADMLRQARACGVKCIEVA